MKPHQIISLMTFDGADNTLSLPDHYDHIHVGFHPLYGDNEKLGKQAELGPQARASGSKLIDRLGKIDNPTVLTQPSKYAIQVARQARQHRRARAATAATGRLFGFVQLEFPWALGPPDGRYVLRGHAGEPEHVLVVTHARRAAAAPARGGRARPGRPSRPRRRCRPRARRSCARRRSATRARPPRWLARRPTPRHEVDAARRSPCSTACCTHQRLARADPLRARGRAATRRSSSASATARASRSPTAAGPQASTSPRARSAAPAARGRAAPAGAPGGPAGRARRAAGLRGARAARAGRPRRRAAAARRRCSCAPR